MPGSYPHHGTESRTLHPALSVISEAVDNCVGELGLRQTAFHIGSSKSTVHQWGSNLESWPAASLLTLAMQSKEVSDALIALLQGQQAPVAVPTNAIPEAYETARLASNLTAELVTDIQDGQFDLAEARRLDTKIESLGIVLEKLRRDVKAAAR